MPETDGLEKLLHEHPFFREMNADARRFIAGCAANERYHAGDYLFREGEAADKFYLLRHGRVALELHLPGCEPLVVDTIQEGDVFGWAWMVAPYKWTLDARATSLVRLLSLDARCLRSKCEADHSLGYELQKRFVPVMAKRLEATRLRLVNMYGTASGGGACR